MSDSVGVIRALPDRPLTRKEATQLEEHASSAFRVRSEATIRGVDQELVIALAVITQPDGRVALVGYNQAANGWEVVDAWTAADVEQAMFTERLKAWEHTTYNQS